MKDDQDIDRNKEIEYVLEGERNTKADCKILFTLKTKRIVKINAGLYKGQEKLHWRNMEMTEKLNKYFLITYLRRDKNPPRNRRQ